MKDWTASLYHQQVKHIYIFITRWKIQHRKIFALKMFLTLEMQMLEQNASVTDPDYSQRCSVPCVQTYLSQWLWKAPFSSQFYILTNLRTASPKKLVSQDFASQNLWTFKKYFNMIWHFFLEQGSPVLWWNPCPFCPLPPAPKGFERQAVTTLHTVGA